MTKCGRTVESLWHRVFSWSMALILAACGAYRPPSVVSSGAIQLTGSEVYYVLPPDASGGPDGCVFESASGDAVGCLFHRLDNGQYVSRFEAWSAKGKVVDAAIYAGWLEGFASSGVKTGRLEKANRWLRSVGARVVDRSEAGVGDATPTGLPSLESCCAWAPAESRVGPAYTVVIFTERCCFELPEGDDPPDDACEEAWASTPDEIDACQSAHPVVRRAVQFTLRPASL